MSEECKYSKTQIMAFIDLRKTCGYRISKRGDPDVCFSKNNTTGWCTINNCPSLKK